MKNWHAPQKTLFFHNEDKPKTGQVEARVPKKIFLGPDSALKTRFFDSWLWVITDIWF